MDFQKPPTVKHTAPVRKRPKVFLWVWRYDSDMSWIDSSRFGIAYLASTIKVSPSSITDRPRLNSLKVPEGTSIEAVVRIEVEPGHVPDKRQSQDIQRILVSQVPVKNVEALQIDFDALKSQRPFYKSLVQELHAKIPKRLPLKMTALASWTLYDRWISDMPVDSVTPMFFRMGKDRSKAIQCLAQGMDTKTKSIGLAVDEPDVFKTVKEHGILSKFKRVYLFSPRGWSKDEACKFAKSVWQSM